MQEDPTRSVAVVNSAQTKFVQEWAGKQHVDLITEVATRVLRGTGLAMDDVDFVIDSGSDFLDGRSISNCGFLGAMGANHKEESRVEEDGLWSLCYAADKIASGAASVGLVVAYSKSSESDPLNYWVNLLDPFIQRPTGLDHFSAAGLTAQRYLAESGLAIDDLRGVTERAWEAATANPWVDTSSSLSNEKWEELVAAPLRRRDVARPMDGAVAVLLASPEVVDQVSSRPVWITGRGSAIDEHIFASRTHDSLAACRTAARHAFAAGGASSALDFDLLEVCADSAVGELLVLEAIGAADQHQGIRAYEKAGAPLINPSGGSLPADVVMASGLARLHEATSRLGGRTGYEGGEARTALVHGTGGFAMQNHCVITLEASA